MRLENSSWIGYSIILFESFLDELGKKILYKCSPDNRGVVRVEDKRGEIIGYILPSDISPTEVYVPKNLPETSNSTRAQRHTLLQVAEQFNS